MPVPRSMLDPESLGDVDLVLVAGVWPEGLGGEVFLATADQRSAAGGHAFYGDGVVVRCSLRPGSFGAPGDRWAWRTAVIDSPSSRLRAARPDVFVSTAVGTSSPFGISNASNTCPIPWGDRLFMAWDAGRPVEVDPVSLRWLGDLGHRDQWQPAIDHPVLPLITTSAHPVIDPERGCLWTVTHDPITGVVAVVRSDDGGPALQRWPLIDVHIPQSMHTISQTASWLILADCAFKPDPNEIFGLGPRSITTNATGPLYLVRKAELDETPGGRPVGALRFEFGPETMHFHAAYDDRHGIDLVIEQTNETDLAFWLELDDLDANGSKVDPRFAGMYCHPMSAGGHGFVRIDPAARTITEIGQLSDADRWWGTQLSAVDWSPAGIPCPTRHHQVFSGWKPELTIDRALRIYAAAGRVDRSTLPSEEQPGMLVSIDRATHRPAGEWAFSLEDYPCSPCFVPRPGGQPGGHDGWVIVPVLNDHRFRLEVFDAGSCSAGPVAVLAAPVGVTVPFLLHSVWMAAAAPAPDVDRLSFSDDVVADRLDVLHPELAECARQVMRELADR